MEPGEAGTGGKTPKQVVGCSENENRNVAPVERVGFNQIPTPDSPEDLLLPATTVHRIMKKVLPPEAKVTKEAKEAMQLCVTQFMNWVMHNANTLCQNETRSLITAEDILFTLRELGFDNYDRIISVFLNRYRASAEVKDNSHDEGPNMMIPIGHPSGGPSPPMALGFIPQFMPPVPAPSPSGVEQEGANITNVNEGPCTSSSSNTRAV